MTNTGAGLYQAQQILTASPARLVATLYQAVITALRQAIHAIENNDIEGRWRANRRAIDIIDHLLMTLDAERGGEIAANLEQLYMFIIRHLVNVDLHNDPAPAREAIALLEPLHRSWRELDRRLLTDAAAAADNTVQAERPAETDGDKQAQETAPGGRLSATA